MTGDDDSKRETPTARRGPGGSRASGFPPGSSIAPSARPAAETPAEPPSEAPSEPPSEAAAEPPPETSIELEPDEDLASDMDRMKRYRAGEVIGRGGMGEVRVAHDRRVGRSVALKVLLERAKERPDAARRFVREARVQGRLEHPSIVPVYDLGTDESGRPFFVMKRVAGVTLSEVIRDLRAKRRDAESKYSTRKLLSIFQSACLAIEYAHSRGVIHRDIKPSNLMLGDFGEVYVLDWGIAKVRDLAEPEGRVAAASTRSRRSSLRDDTGHDEILGSLGYMAPEQLDKATTVDARTDVYSLGAVLFELLTLEPLHDRRSEAELARSTTEGVDARPSMRSKERDVPPELDLICIRATAIERDERYPSARALHDAIEAYLEGDRDLRLRSELSLRHLELARRAFDDMALGGSSEAHGRKKALREAGRALALDPNLEEATSIVARLMLVPPSEMPTEARVAGDRTRHAEIATALQLCGIGMGLAAILFAGVPLVTTVRSWPTLMFAMLMGGITVAHMILLGRSKTADFTVHTPFIAAEFAGVVTVMSFVVGPLLFAPLLAVGGSALLAIAHGLGRYRALSIFVLWVGWAVPAWFESIGRIPPSYAIENGTITIFPRLLEFDPATFRLGMFAVNSLATVVIATILWRYGSFIAKNRELQDLHTWHLENIAAHGGRGRASTPPPPRADRNDA